MKIIHYSFFVFLLFSCSVDPSSELKAQLKKSTTSSEVLKVGDIVDTLNGVFIYYNGSVGHVSERNLSKDGYNLGLKYQCVEFVKRYYYEFFKHKMPDSYGHAKEFYSKNYKDGEINTKRNLIQYTNGSCSKPEIHDLLVFDGHEYNPYGHVVIISNVGEDFIEITQQNPGPSAPSRERMALAKRSNLWFIEDDLALGWLRIKRN